MVAALRALGHEADLLDLYACGFEPLLVAGEAGRDAVLPPGISEAVRQLSLADGVVIVHPNWWGMPPAVLVGWVDRVVRVGSAYRFESGDAGGGTPIGMLRAQRAVVFNTSDTYPEREQRVFGDPLDRIWRDCVFGLCGIEDVRRRTFGVMVTSSAEERASWLDEVERITEDAFPRALAGTGSSV